MLRTSEGGNNDKGDHDDKDDDDDNDDSKENDDDNDDDANEHRPGLRRGARTSGAFRDTVRLHTSAWRSSVAQTQTLRKVQF